MMKPRLYLAAAAAIVVVAFAWFTDRDAQWLLHVGEAWPHEVVPIDGVGPESLAFSPDGQGPYTGVSDGRIIRWDQNERRWVNFTVSSPHSGGNREMKGGRGLWRGPRGHRQRNACLLGMMPCGWPLFVRAPRRSGHLLLYCHLPRREGCGGTSYEEHRKTEHICGRPLGLCFSPNGDLYIADAYFGLLAVPSNGTIPTYIASQVEDTPLSFTNNLDIDQSTGVVYFTSSSSTFHRKDYVSLILSRDETGMVIKYEPETKQVSVVLRNVSFANGVALSKQGEYILVAETSKCRVLRYWLATRKAGTLEVFAEVPGFPDNIKRSPRGGYWVGIFARQERLVGWILSYPWIGKAMLKLLPVDITKAYSYLAKVKGKNGFAIRLSEEGEVFEMVEGKGRGRSVSEVEERDGTLWMGSVDSPFAVKHQIPVRSKKVSLVGKLQWFGRARSHVSSLFSHSQ